ncbi:MAG: hypothetical protein JXK94_12525 [Deltaproteobacteria bacterium]|nr:hypothetical protein [Deltaproteobacteria bacterium]
MTKPKGILYILIAIFLLAVVYAYVQYPRQSRIADSAVESKSQVRRPVSSKSEPAEDNRFRVRFDWLKKQRPFSGAKEDLFGPLYGAKKGPSILPVQKKVSPQPAFKRTDTSALSTPPLNFLGFLASGKSRTYFFSQGEDVFVAKKGAKFGKQKEFSIVAATSKAVKIRKQGDEELLNISLVEKNAVSGFNKQKAEKREEGKPFSSKPSDFIPQPQSELAKEAEEEPPPPVQEFHPEGDWEK